jgi:hypothetical protein
MYTQIIRFGSKEHNERFLFLYWREVSSQFQEELIKNYEDVMRSLEEKEFIKDVHRIGGATRFRLSDKGDEFASTFV